MKRHRARPIPATLLAAAAAAAATLPLAQPCAAGALTDGSVGAVQSFSGRFTLPQSLGTTRGGNLFHSFTRFSLDSAEVATFTTGDATIRNVISRVTGGEASTLQGTLQLQAAAGSQPDFYFVNPSGITVAKGAVIDVPAGLHLATAPQLKFGDGFVWDTRSGQPSTLTVAAPESFGFLGNQAAAALRWQGSDLTLAGNGTLELAAGSVAVSGGLLSAPGGRISVSAPGAVELSGGARLYAIAGNDSSSGLVHVDAGSLTIDTQGAGKTGLLSAAGFSPVAPGGGIDVKVVGVVRIANGAEVTISNASPLPWGMIGISADTLAIDGAGSATGIGSYGMRAGGGPDVNVNVAGRLSVTAGGQIFTAAFGAGDGGRLGLRAGSLAMDGQGDFAFVGTQSLSDATGTAGRLDVNVRDALTMRAGGQISSTGRTLGAAGDLSVSAGSMQLDGQHALESVTGIRSFGGAAMVIDVAGSLDILAGAAISSSSSPLRNPGDLTVRARSIRVDGGGDAHSEIAGFSSNASPSASLNVTASESITLVAGGQINSATYGSGSAGSVRIKAPGITMTGGGSYVTGVYSSTVLPEGGDAGDVSIDATRLTLRGGAQISSQSVSDTSTAGRIAVSADTVLLDGQGLLTDIESVAWGAQGNAGKVDVQARQQLTLINGASIQAVALGRGSPGEISVTTPQLTIDGAHSDSYTGIGGDSLGGGAGSAISVNATRIDLRESGQISSSTYSESPAGSIRVTADTLTVDGGGNVLVASGISADTSGSGPAGNIAIQAREVRLTNEGMVSSSTLARGAGGSIRIDAQQLTIDTSGSVVTIAASRGAAGSIDLHVNGAMELRDGGIVAANTGGAGAAGRISITAGSFNAGGTAPADGGRSRVVSRALAASGGQPGSITLDVAGSVLMQADSVLGITNDARVSATAASQVPAIAVHASQMDLQGAEITAAASANANAGSITLATIGRMTLDGATVRTSAVDGNGGPIAIDAGGLVRLRDSQVTTSVDGRNNGNGGNIRLAANALVLESGFIQANTAAAQARGGNVRIDVAALVPNGSNLFVGGNRIEAFRTSVPGFNVIQAAAPDGLSGTLDVTLPQLNLAGSLVGLATPRIDFGPIGRDVCQVDTESRLTLLGRGALPPSAATPLRLHLPVPRQVAE